MRVRNAVTRSGKGYRGHFPSRKLNRMVQFESLLERDAIYLFELSPGVVSYQEQPAIISYEHQGSTHRYIPDFELRLYNQVVMHIEVKPEAAFSNPQLTAKYSSIAHRYQDSDIEFAILTERAIRQIPLLPNLKLLYRSLRSSRSIDPFCTDIRRYLQAHGSLHLNHLAAAFERETILTMLAKNILTCDFQLVLSDPENLIRVSKEADHATLWF